MKEIKVAVIGTGHWGKNLLRNFAEMGNLAAICDPNTKVAEQFASEYNTKALDWSSVLSSEEIHAVIIAAPAVLHAKLAKEALNADKHVYVEKPLALNISDAEELCTLASEKKRTLMVGHLLQYHPAFLKCKDLIQSGKLGKLKFLYSNRLSLGKFRQEEDVLWSFAPHDISMILSLVGTEPTEVHASGTSALQKGISDFTTTQLHFPGGEHAQIFTSWLHPFKEQKLVVIGDKAMAVFDDREDWDSKVQFYPHKVNWESGNPLPEKADAENIPLAPSEPLRSECEHFIHCVSTGETPRTDGKEGLRVLKVLNKASQSIALETHERSHPGKKQEAKNYYAHESSIIDSPSQIGNGTKIWHFSHILGNSKIGENCTVGQNVMIGPDVTIGNNCKIQNNVSLYKGVTLEDGVFCGPSCVFTNVNNPRAEIERKDSFDTTHVEKGVTIGANATIVCGTRLGAYSFVGAGAVVTKNIPPHTLVVGSPAKQVGWVSHAGEKLDHTLTCPREGRQYSIVNEKLVELRKAECPAQ